MQIGIGSLLQETNSFSPVKTTVEDFAIAFGNEALERWRSSKTEGAGFCEVLSRSGAEIVPLFAGWAITAGPIYEVDFERMKSLVVETIRKRGNLDAILLSLHGAMCADGTDDCEGTLLRAIRAVVGPDLPIVITLDLHANVTQELVLNVSAITGYKTYPHVDTLETGQAGARLLLRQLRKEIHPAITLQKIPLIVPAENMQTERGPMAEAFALGQRFQHDHPEILDVSVFGVQPWLDIQEMGCAVTVTFDQPSMVARKCAVEMAKRFWDLREAFAVQLLSPRDAIRTALQAKGQPVVISESSDSPTAGAPGDSADLLRALLEHAPGVPAAIWVRDGKAVAHCWKQRPGARVQIEVGGTVDSNLRRPVTVDGVIRSLSDGRFVFKGAWNAGMETSMGRTAVLEINRISVVLSEWPVNMIEPEVYRCQGIEPRDKKIVVVKSANGFRSEYGSFAAGIILVDTPGVCSANLRSLPYRRVQRPIYPLDDLEFNPEDG